MQEYVVGEVDEIPEGKGISVQAGRRTIAVFRVGREFFAIHNTCPHKGASLADGMVVCEDKVVRCPWHHWNWSLESGRVEPDPSQGIRTYEIAVDGDDVILKV
jgi:nitrite reductase (NADH) small subunit/3-phenylpropionate/trans-cinnamate dioxygenase ferredoxin subunit